MKIHSNVLTHDHFADAVRHASSRGQGIVWTTREDERGSRSRARAFDVALVSDGTVQRHRPQSWTGDASEYAATWDQWGWFLASVFAVDPDAIAGPYKGIDDFRRKTDGAYLVAFVGKPIDCPPGRTWVGYSDDDVHVFAPGSGPLPDSDPEACDVCGEDADHHNHNVPDPSLED